MTAEIEPRRRWSEEETILALYLYFQLPFGQLHSGNSEIVALATAIGRSPSSVAMKLCNFASLDPAIIETGRKGLTGASKLDRATYESFSDNWTSLKDKAEQLWDSVVAENSEQPAAKEATRLKEHKATFGLDLYSGNTERNAFTSQRIGQNFFRRAVLANYEERCCVTGIADSRLLVASHIKPWTVDELNRHNPANGLLLSATFDKAFDRGLITVRKDKKIRLSSQLRDHPSDETRSHFLPFDKMQISRAARFEPDPMFLEWHECEVFLDSRQQQ